MPGGVYCSDECYQKMNAFQDRVKALDKTRKPGFAFGKLAGRLIGPVIVIALLYYLLVVEGVRSVGDFLNVIQKLIP